MKVVFLIGTRPQYIKLGALYPHLKNTDINPIFVDSGQHYDYEMSDIFIKELRLPANFLSLSAGSGTHAQQTGNILEKFEKLITEMSPDIGVVFGDTNTTLAGALVFAKLNIPFAHVESGLRSFDNNMPEEINRKITDRLASFLFCPSQNSVENLKKEGISEGVYLTGDVSFDIYKRFKHKFKETRYINSLGLEPDHYYALTMHRQENTHDTEFLNKLLDFLTTMEWQFAFPVHPRIAPLVKGRRNIKNVLFLKPVSYINMQQLIYHSRGIITDSGGLQKEAFFAGKRIITLRSSTEWIETVNCGLNILVGKSISKLESALSLKHVETANCSPYGDGNAASRVIEIIEKL